jgi:pumilio RNA-binding family
LQAFGNTESVDAETLPRKPAAADSGNPKLSAQLKALEACDDAFSDSVKQVRGSVRSLAFDAAGCRALQNFIEKASFAGCMQDAANLVLELHGCVRQALSSKHANHVLQKIIEVLPTASSRFVCQELSGSGAKTSRHQYGCRILCRLVEHSSQDSATGDVIDEVVAEAVELSRHAFGHHVLKSILEHGLPEQKERIAIALEADLVRNASDRSASYVIEAALQHCAPEDQECLATSLLNQPECLVRLAEDRSGYHVVKALRCFSSQGSQAARNHVTQAADRLQLRP